MSSVAKISGRKRLDSHENIEFPDYYTPTYAPDESDEIPFQEFLDTDINNEKWEPMLRFSTGELEKFQDVYSVLLPPSLEGYEWKPLEEVFPGIEYVIKNDTTSDRPDLIKENKHLLHSEFIRSFISSIETLYYLGNVKGFSVEHTSLNFAPSFEKDKWRPWHHIYSNCKAGKMYPHAPTVTKLGKYIVRLFWLGSWKKIYVSDRLPVNSKNQLLLPCVYNPDFDETVIKEESMSSKVKATSRKDYPRKRYLEIWPFLLTKALMILASLTWTRDNELTDFDIIQCLTGWIAQKIDISRMDPLKVWEICMDHTFQYTWSEDQPQESKKASKDKISTKAVSTKSVTGMPSRTTSRAFSSKNLRAESRLGVLKKSYMHVKPKEEEINKNRFVVVLGIKLESLIEPIEWNSDWTHGFLVAQTRTVPILKPSTDEEFEAWKRFRWIDWAIENNLINPRCPPHPIRSFRTVDPFKYQYQPTLSIREVSSIGFSSIQPSYIGKTKKHSSPEVASITEWLDLECIDQFLKYITVYYVASTYKSKARISNLSCENITKELKYPFAKSLVDLLGLHWKELIRPVGVQSHRNEPIYIFCDCLFKQNVVIHLNQTGCLQTITERHVEKVIVPSETMSECGVCVTTFLERVKRNCAKPKNETKEGTRTSICKVIPNIPHEFPKATLIVSKFKWDSNRCDDIETSMTTLGSSSLVLQMKPGRHIFTMWIKVEGPYTVQIVSDNCLCIGNLEETLTLMSRDSLLFREAYWTLVENLQMLIYSFGTHEYMHDLNQFYKNFKPHCEMTKKELMEVEEIFFKEFFDIIGESLGAEALRGIKILFRKWQFGSKYRCDVTDVSQLCYPVDEEDMHYVKIMHESAVKIQSFFRGIYERILLSHHDIQKKNFDKIASILTMVAEKFSLNDRKLGAIVLRKFIQNPTILDLGTKFSWYETLANDICTAQFTTQTKINDPGWVFIARHIFYITTENPLIIRINIFCNLNQYYLRVFDNDTSKEMKNSVNNVAVNEYPPNTGGYTAVAYGWTTLPTFMNCKIIFACRQDNIDELLTFSTKSPKKETISDYYVPNSGNILCRYILTLSSPFTILTMHLSTDYPKVGIKLRIFDSANPERYLTEVAGVGYVTVPALLLQNDNEVGSSKAISLPTESDKILTLKLPPRTRSGRRSSKGSYSSDTYNPERIMEPNYFIIEAFLEKNSWPLTSSEWINVEKERDKLEVGGEVKTRSISQTVYNSGRLSIKSCQSSKRDGPRWTMEIFYNHTDYVSFLKDPEKADLLKQTKMAWYVADPERYEISQNIRKEFIANNLQPNPNVCLDPDVRSLDREIFLENILPPLDFTAYLKKPLEEVKERRLNTDKELWTNHYKILFDHINCVIDLDFAEKFKTNYYKEEIRKLYKIKEWFDGVRRDSDYMMEQAYKKRERYINHVVMPYLPRKKSH